VSDLVAVIEKLVGRSSKVIIIVRRISNIKIMIALQFSGPQHHIIDKKSENRWQIYIQCYFKMLRSPTKTIDPIIDLCEQIQYVSIIRKLLHSTLLYYDNNIYWLLWFIARYIGITIDCMNTIVVYWLKSMVLYIYRCREYSYPLIHII